MQGTLWIFPLPQFGRRFQIRFLTETLCAVAAVLAKISKPQKCGPGFSGSAPTRF
jgi:hypothetical protein